jgi:DNA-binding NarL/FixJ family response regulator
MANATPERILVVDDHPLVRDGCAAFWRHVRGLRHSRGRRGGRSLHRAAEHGECDLVLLDLNMPDATRLSGLVQLRSLSDGAGADGFGQLRSRPGAGSASAGAAGFLPKSMKRDGIVNALHMVMAGEIYIPDTGLEETPPAPRKHRSARASTA